MQREKPTGDPPENRASHLRVGERVAFKLTQRGAKVAVGTAQKGCCRQRGSMCKTRNDSGNSKDQTKVVSGGGVGDGYKVET